MRPAPWPILLLLAGCSILSKRQDASPNRWADKRLWPVLEAQEHRDTEALCALLKDTAAPVRSAAALAFASLQDTLGIPCLIVALADTDTDVRRHAVFALGLVADSATVPLVAERSLVEKDSAVQSAYFSASFLALQHNGLLKDLPSVIYFMERSAGHDRVRAADAVHRLPADALIADSTLLFMALDREPDPEVRAMLLRALAKVGGPGAERRLLARLHPDIPAVERIAATRTVAGRTEPPPQELYMALRDTDAGVRQAALDALMGLPAADATACLELAGSGIDTLLRLQVLGLVLRHGDERQRANARGMIRSLSTGASGPYHRAAALRSLAAAPDSSTHVELLSAMQGDAPAVIRQAAFQGLLEVTRAVMARSRFASLEDQYRQLGIQIMLAIATKDPGLICAAAEVLLEEQAETIGILLPPSSDAQALASLQPIRDLEAILLLKQAIAKRDGGPPLQPAPSAFNHPIDPVNLRALKQGQRYRITTAKGTIILATDVNDCPGSSLAFDSLVTAGYYNGKVFHRMVPNFVVQGGCPRGDGYGGMPWTLRTEIGRKFFTAGSVGLASAGRDTESCQFFITHVATPHLDGRYTRFGEVVEGMDVVMQLEVGDVMRKVEQVE